jgi:hypothetical protein
MTNDTKPREFWIKGDYVYPSEPANVGKTIHVIEKIKYDELELENARLLRDQQFRHEREKRELQAQLDATQYRFKNLQNDSVELALKHMELTKQCEKLAEVLKGFSGRDGYEKVNKALAEYERFKSGK